MSAVKPCPWLIHDSYSEFKHPSAPSRILGNARCQRAGFGILPKRTSIWISSSIKGSGYTKVRESLEAFCQHAKSVRSPDNRCHLR